MMMQDSRETTGSLWQTIEGHKKSPLYPFACIVQERYAFTIVLILAYCIQTTGERQHVVVRMAVVSVVFSEEVTPCYEGPLNK